MNQPAINKKLQKSLKKYYSEKHLVGRLSDEILQLLINDYRKAPQLNKMIKFISCLNFFYSTRVQAAQGTLNDAVINIAKVINNNWIKGLNLSAIKERKEIDIYLVDNLRKQIKLVVKRDLFSLTTKIFHQLNSQYPIYDTNVVKFLKKDAVIGRVNLFKSYDVFCEHYFKTMAILEWDSKNVDQFDSAIWVM